MTRNALLHLLLALSTTFAATAAPAQTRFGRLRSPGGLEAGLGTDGGAPLPDRVRVVRDIAYGTDPAQRFDVYLSTRPAPGTPAAPVIFFVHGGGWARGDKITPRVVEPKVAHWVERGWVVISTNYRLLPTPVATQAEDVASALAFAQSQAGTWGADPTRFVLMGHSAGAHLVALIAAGAKTAARPQPWRAAVLLDSAALDVPLVMNSRHIGLYDRAFGRNPAHWDAVSPYAALARGTTPFLEVCSSRRKASCPQADRFAAKANALDGQARVLREDLSHGEINATLGAPSAYTAQVDDFLASVR